MTRLRMRSRRGFSLVELMVVAVVIMAIAAILLPKITTMISDYNLKSTMGQVAGMLQQQRIQAVRLNQTIQMGQGVGTDHGRSTVWVDLSNDTTPTWNAGEPIVVLPKNIGIQPTGFPGNAATPLGYTAENPSTAVVKFNARGLPCKIPSTGTLCSTNVGFVLYFQNTGSFGVPSWGAVTITPGGRVRSWFYNGSSYSPM